MYQPNRRPRTGRYAFTSRKAFTLIELLVVIAIIAILAAILFPVFAQAREKARQAACLSNTKQMALGIMQYTNDYDELLPVQGDNGQARGRWTVQIFPYVKNADVFTCPNLPTARLQTNAAAFNPTASSAISGYGWNNALGSDPTTWNGTSSAQASGMPLASVAKPAATIIVGDVGIDTGYCGSLQGYVAYARDPALYLSNPGTTPWYFVQFRHNTTKTTPLNNFAIPGIAGSTANVDCSIPGGNATIAWPTEGRANFSFLDGHSKSLDRASAFQKDPAYVNGSNGGKEDGQALNNGETIGSDPTANPNYLWNRF